MDITQEMVDQSSREEGELLSQSPEVLLAQNRHLNNRVVLLRALVNEQQKKIDSLEEKLEKKSASKNVATKKTTSPRRS